MVKAKFKQMRNFSVAAHLIYKQDVQLNSLFIILVNISFQMFGFLTLLLLTNCYFTFGLPYNTNYLMKREEKLCGPTLMKTLRLVCNGIYYGKEKKSCKYFLM